MSNGQVRIKVYTRIPAGTILYWNTECLSEEQRNNIRVYIRLPGEDNWVAASVGMPDLTKMKPMDYAVTGTTMILHGKEFTEYVPFEVKLVFGVAEMKEGTLMVEAKSLHQPYVKPVRGSDGQWALPTVIVDVSEEVIRKLAKKDN